MSVCLDHDFELQSVVKEIERHNAKRILIQLPEGFKQCFNYLVEKLREHLSREVEVILSLNPSFGPCLVDEYSAREVNADLVIHFGHTEYTYYKPAVKTLFIPVEFSGIDVAKLVSILNNFCTLNSRICLVSSSQHIRLCNNLVKLFNKCGITYRGVVFGCTKVDTKDCDILVVVGGGRFLCVSQYLMNLDSKLSLATYCIDPYTYSLWDPKEEVEKMMRVRVWKIYNALNSRRWLIVSGFYGQARDNFVRILAEELKKRGFEVSVAKVLKLDREMLVNISSLFDVIVIASCPYLAFDFQDLEIPVLTVGEAFVILSNAINRYRYPW